MYLSHHKRKTPYIHVKYGGNAIVILCHGFLWHKNNNLNKSLREQFSLRKIDTLAFDFYGHGDAWGEISSMNLNYCIEDLSTVIDYVTKHYKKIYLVANSMWWLVTLCSTAIHDQLEKVVLRAPVSDRYKKEYDLLWAEGIEQWLHNGFIERLYGDLHIKLSASLLESIKKHNGYKLAWSLHCPVLIIHGEKDDKIPIEQSYKLKEILPNAELHVVPDGGHSRKSSEKKTILEDIVSFITSENYSVW